VEEQAGQEVESTEAEAETVPEPAADITGEQTTAAAVPTEEEAVIVREEEEDTTTPEDIVVEGSSEGWLSEMYFIECCLEAAEAIRNNADRLDGPPSKRTARMLSDWVEYLLRLSADFGITETDGAIEALRQRLGSIAAGARKSDAAEVEALLSALSSLERECERVTVASV